MKVDEINLNQILTGLSFESNPDIRANYENYINALLNDKQNCLENIQKLVSFFQDKSMSKQLLIILKKFTKVARNLEQDQASALLDHCLQSMLPFLTESELNLFTDFIIEFLTQVFSITSTVVSEFLNRFLGELGIIFNKTGKEDFNSILALSLYSKFLKHLLGLSVTANKLYVEAQKTYKPLFENLNATIEKMGISNLVQRGAERMSENCLKVQELLARFYRDCSFLRATFFTLFKPLINSLKKCPKLPEFLQRVLEKLSKTYFKIYVVLILNQDFLKELLQLYCSLYLAEMDDTFENSTEKLNVYFLNLRIFILLIQDFAIDGDFSLSVSTETNQNDFQLEQILDLQFPKFYSIIKKTYRVLLPLHVNTFNGPSPLLSDHLDFLNLDFKNCPQKCATKFITTLFDYYCKRLEYECDDLIKTILHQFEGRLLELEISGKSDDFYLWLTFIETNLFRIMNLFSVDFIVQKLLTLDFSLINYPCLSFLQSYFEEYAVPEHLIISGVHFCQSILTSTQIDCYRYIGIVILLNFQFKMQEKEEYIIQLNFKIIFHSFFTLLTNSVDGNVHDLGCMLSLLEEIIKSLEQDCSEIEEIINAFFTILEISGYSDTIELVHRTVDMFAEFFITIPKVNITLPIFQKCFVYLNKILAQFKQTQNISFLNSFSKLFIFFVAKFEALLDIFLEQIVSLKLEVELAVSFCRDIISVINSVLSDTLCHYLDNLMFNEIILSMFAIANVFTKIYVIVNCKSLIMKPVLGETSFYVDIKSFDQRFSFPKKVENKSEIKIEILTQIGDIQFIKIFLDSLASFVQFSVLSKNSEFFTGLINVLEFFSLCFPFFVEEICDIIFRAFDLLDGNLHTEFRQEEPHIFSSITRIVARIIFCYPRSLFAGKNEIYNRIILFLNRVKFGGRYQETLSQGILLVEYLEVLAEGWNQDFLSLFASLNLKESENTGDEKLKILVILNILEMILRHLNETMFFHDDLVWENLKAVINASEGFGHLVF